MFNTYSIENAPEGSVAGLEATKKAFGFVPNLQTYMAESPALLNGYSSLWDIYHKQSGLSALEQQVVLLTINYENHCHYCMAGHSTLAKMQKMEPAVLEALREGTVIPDARLEALREFTRSVVVNRGFVKEQEVEQLLGAGYQRQTVFDVIAAVALKVMSNYTNHITGTPLDSFMQSNAWTHPADRHAVSR